MKLKIGIFCVSFILICSVYGILSHLDPHVIVMLVWIAAALVLTGLFFVARGMYREGRALDQYDPEQQLLCPVCGFDHHSSPQRCPQCGTDYHHGAAEVAEAGGGRSSAAPIAAEPE